MATRKRIKKSSSTAKPKKGRPTKAEIELAKKRSAAAKQAAKTRARNKKIREAEAHAEWLRRSKAAKKGWKKRKKQEPEPKPRIKTPKKRKSRIEVAPKSGIRIKAPKKPKLQDVIVKLTPKQERVVRDRSISGKIDDQRRYDERVKFGQEIWQEAKTLNDEERGRLKADLERAARTETQNILRLIRQKETEGDRKKGMLELADELDMHVNDLWKIWEDDEYPERAEAS